MKIEVKTLTCVSLIPVRRVPFMQGIAEMAVRNIQLIQRIERQVNRGHWQRSSRIGDSND